MADWGQCFIKPPLLPNLIFFADSYSSWQKGAIKMVSKKLNFQSPKNVFFPKIAKFAIAS